MVEQPTLGTQPRGQEREIGAEILRADVLGEPDRGDGVEPGLVDVAVVEETHLGAILQPTLGDGLLRPRGLRGRQRHAQRLDPVVLGGMHDHPAPPGADIEQAVARLEGQLAADQLELLGLRLLQRGLR